VSVGAERSLDEVDEIAVVLDDEDPHEATLCRWKKR